jgi:hypothetical protein
MPTVWAFTPKFHQHTDDNLLGDALKVYTYEAGTSTKLSTYTDYTGNSANTNPTVLNARGEMNLWLDITKLYKIILTTADESDPPITNIWSVDFFGFPQSIPGSITGVFGKCSVPVMAVSVKPSFTNGCADIAAVAMGAGKPDIVSLDFDATTEESGQFFIRMPTNWDEGTITYQTFWSHAATTTNFGTVWGLSAVATGNDDSMNVSFGTEITVTDTGGTTNDIYISPESSAMTVAGTPQAGDYVSFKIARKTGEAGDTMAIDARLMGLTIFVTTDAAIG